MKTRRQVGKGFNAWRNKSRRSFKFCHGNDFDEDVSDYLSGLFSKEEYTILAGLFRGRYGSADGKEFKFVRTNAQKAQLEKYKLKVYKTRRFRSFFKKCLFEQSRNFSVTTPFQLTKEIMRKALNKWEKGPLNPIKQLSLSF